MCNIHIMQLVTLVHAFDVQHYYQSSMGRSGTVARISDTQSRETRIRIQCSHVERLKTSFDVHCFSLPNCMTNTYMYINTWTGVTLIICGVAECFPEKLRKYSIKYVCRGVNSKRYIRTILDSQRYLISRIKKNCKLLYYLLSSMSSQINIKNW